MKLTIVYSEYKKIYQEYVLLLESGIFYNVYNNDAGIINRLLNYKMKYCNDTYIVGFPISSLHNVLDTLKNKKINYVVLDKNDMNEYFISDKLKNNQNQYHNYIFDYKRLNYLNKRIDDIHLKLLQMVNNSNIENLLLKIERLL